MQARHCATTFVGINMGAVNKCLTLAIVAMTWTAWAHAESIRVFPPGQLPSDVRLGPLKDLDGYFPFTPPMSRDAWKPRAERVRRQILVSQGLWPLPTKSPLNAVIHSPIQHADYSVEKVYFESMPGFFVTGSLYRPKGRTGRLPGVLAPHGHWADGRFATLNDAALKKELESGGERLAEGGRSIFQSLGVQLARMGCVTFLYDMLGYADSQQISFEVAHRFARQRPEMNRPESWGLFSPRAEAHAQSVMGLQSWNSIRALDFLTSLPDVDPHRIGMTGGSGGGTQTFICAAVDSRISVQAPAVMVSTAMQGGCTCENACGLRIGSGNIEFAALFAPKPLGMTAADDWTKEMPAKGFPELKQHYTLMGAPENVELWAMLQFAHNYNGPSREKIYGWFARHFKLNAADPISEREYPLLQRAQLTVWNAEHPAPPGGTEFEAKLLRWWRDDAQTQITKSLDDFRRVANPAWEVILGRTLSEAGEVEWEPRAKRNGNGYVEGAGVLRNKTHGEELPAILLTPTVDTTQVAVRRFGTVIWLDALGKAGLFENGEPRAEVRQLLDARIPVLGIDLLFQGEFLEDGQPITQTRRVKNPREAAAYTFGYNHPLFAQRVHDVLTAIRLVRGDSAPFKTVGLVAFGAAGPIAAAARVVAGQAIDGSAIDSHGFLFAEVDSITDVNFLPGAAKYGDLPGLFALAAPARLCVLDQKAEPADLVRTAYRGHENRLHYLVRDSSARTQAIRWLLTEGLPEPIPIDAPKVRGL